MDDTVVVVRDRAYKSTFKVSDDTALLSGIDKRDALRPEHFANSTISSSANDQAECDTPDRGFGNGVFLRRFASHPIG